jgi:hypothetical protein
VTLQDYLRARGLDPADSPGLQRRMFVDCWYEPGFHRFWRLWNPLFGYGLYRLYVALGGNRRPAAASLAVFVLCGALHDALLLVTARRVSVVCTVAFAVYWLLAVVARWLEPRQASWRRGFNAAANALQIAVGLGCGIVADHLFRSVRGG